MQAKLVVLAALSLAACNKPEVVVAPPPTPLPIATPEPAPVAIATPTAAPVRHLAPEGVFYLVSWVRVEKDDGITGLPPGTGVKLVRPGVYLTPAGEWPMVDNLVTNDLDVARAARDSAVSREAASKQWQAAEQARAAAAADARQKADSKTNSAQLADLDRLGLTRKLDALRQRKAALETEISNLSAAQSRENYGRRILGRIESNSSGDAIGPARADLAQVEGQIRDAEAALARLK